MNVYVYGMKSRGFSPGCQPTDGLLESETDPMDDYWDLLFYSRKLSREEEKAYDLDFIRMQYRDGGEP